MSGLSGGGNRVPDYRREIDALKAEIKRLWRALDRDPADLPATNEIIFSWSGSVNPGAGRTSGRWLAPEAATIGRITYGARVASSGTVNVQLLVNNVVTTTFPIPAGSTQASKLIVVSVGRNHPVQIRLTGSSGAQDVTVAVGYAR